MNLYKQSCTRRSPREVTPVLGLCLLLSWPCRSLFSSREDTREEAQCPVPLAGGGPRDEGALGANGGDA
jgi:hypothetical protein